MVTAPPLLAQVAAVSSVVGDDAYADVIGHCRTPVTNETRYTNAHETSHFISSALRRPGVNGFYLGNGQAILLVEPDVTLADVARYVRHKGWRFKTYFVEAWNDRPLYVLDEFTAYIWGATVAVQDADSGRRLERTDAVSGCMEFATYAAALAECVEAEDPGYWASKDGDALRWFLAAMINRADRLFVAGLDVEAFKSARQDAFLARWSADMAAVNVAERLAGVAY